MSTEGWAKIEKLGKLKISITFPEGTSASVKQSVPLKELLAVLEGSDDLEAKSIFRISPPGPSNPS